eukprot:14187063-Alexandrium_andersonii.AAC.1
MSASLVGSEMCIRDSAMTVPASGRRNGLAWVARADPPRSSCRLPRRRDPVSYTHLTLPTICSV